MLKKILVIGLLLSTVTFSSSLTAFASTDEKDIKEAEKVKVEINKLGVGENAKVEVKLKDGKKVKGFISEVNNDGFVVTNASTSVSTQLSYDRVKQVKGNNLSTGVKIAIVVGVILVVAAILGKAFAQ